MNKFRKNEQGFGLVEGLLILLIIAVVGLGGYYVYNTQNETKVNNSDTNADTTSSDYAEGYRGGTSGVKLTEIVQAVASQTLDILGTYYKQNNEYPNSETVPMNQLWWKYGYNGASAGASMKCPEYNGHFSYTGYEDPESGVIKTFNLYYCDGPTLVTKSQSDIL